MAVFTLGPKVSIDDLPEAEARAIFGDALYESWQRYKKEARGAGTLTITSIDKEPGVITVGPSEPNSEGSSGA